MGAYVYRVTAKQVTCSDGKKANVAVFAYKPYWSWDGEKINNKMHFKSGATSSDRMATRGRLTDRVVFASDSGVPEPGSAVFYNLNNCGSFYDDIIGASSMPKVKEVSVA